MKKLVAIIALLCIAAVSHAETVTLTGLEINIPDNWTIVSLSESDINVESDDSVVISIGCTELGLSADIVAQVAEARLLEMIYDATLEFLPYDIDADYVIEELESGKKALFFSGDVKSPRAYVYVAMMIVDTRFVMIVSVGTQGMERVERHCRDALNWINFSPAKPIPPVDEKAMNTPQTARYELNDAQIYVNIDDNMYNVFTNANSNYDAAIIRSGYDATRINSYMALSNYELAVSYIDEDLLIFSVNVRVKKDMYGDIGSFKELPSYLRPSVMDVLVSGFNGASDYTIYERDDVCYCVFDCVTSGYYERRYATVYDDDMIYVFAQREGEPLTDADLELLETIIDSMEYD